MRFRPTLGQLAHVLMIVTLCIALWKLVARENGNKPWTTYKHGDHLASTIWRTMPDAKRTVVVVTRSECGFCTASMPFYGDLVRVAASSGVEVVSVTPEDNATNQRYLESHGVHVSRTIQLKDTPLKVLGTPTLIVMDQSKMVLGAWVGKLVSDDQEKVLQLVRSGYL